MAQPKPIQCLPGLQPAKQTSYQEAFTQRMQGDMAPLLPVDSDIAAHAEILESTAKEQQSRRFQPSGDEVMR